MTVRVAVVSSTAAPVTELKNWQTNLNEGEFLAKLTMLVSKIVRGMMFKNSGWTVR